MRFRSLLQIGSPFLILGCAAAGAAQQGFFKFQHFKSYPSGRWSTELQGFRNGVALGPPQTTIVCSSPLSAPDMAKIKALGNAAASSCTGRVLVDQPLTAEYEQVCSFSPSRQTIHQTLHAVDDHTLTSEVRSNIPGSGVGETVMRSTAHYLGACSASETAAAATAPSALKPDAKTCAEFPETKKQIEGALQSCAQLPGQYRADCVSRVQGSLRGVQVLEAGCK